MKICQVRLKIIALILIILIVNIFIINIGTARAFSINPLALFQINNDTAIAKNETTIKTLQAQADALTAKEATAIKTAPIGDKTAIDAKIAALKAENEILKGNNKQYTWTKLFEQLKDQSFEIAGAAFKAAVGNFLNTLAADTATYLATGNEGQGPMFETRPLSKVLTDAADNAAGTFLETLGKSGPIKFNLCTPNPSVMLKINLGLQQYKPKAPACTFTQLTKNWNTALKDKDFLPKFQDMFNPWSNDLGIALTLQTGMETEINKQSNLALENVKKNQGLKDVTDQISGFIKTPAKVIASKIDSVYTDSTKKELTWTGTVADAIDIFINTLAGKLMDKWLKKGIVTNFPANNSGGLTDPNAQNPAEGVTGAENRFRSLTEPSFKVRGDYDILAELTMCPDPNKAGPTNCVIEEKFREAIEKRLTVKEAMDQGYLNANGVFGFTSDGLEPKYNEGYPYRSMLILRKFRILPVGWEVAAEKIKDGQAGGTKNLSDLVNCKTGWCAGLVDPNWVLKAEQNFCKKEGAGPEILSEEVVDGGLSVVRNDTYCADEQSCFKEKSDGSCQSYGYCTQERRIWDFNGKSCAPIDNTCQTFQLGDQTVSYLQNTLDYGVCNSGNAGCKKYATVGAYNATSKTIVWDGNTNPVYLNKSAETCEAADQGCHSFIRITPEQTETYADIKTAGVDAAYNRFNSTGLIYEKLLPAYLQDVCYEDKGTYYKPKDNAPAECSDFVRQCKAEEAGCELYTNVADSSKIPAKVGPNDYCPAECAGYNTFVQQATTFDSSRDAYFIPKTAKTCSAEAVGCDQFTNLDEVAKGGEGIEYYTSLRQCLKKTGNEGSCGEFYTWEGSDESGYQLKVESLKVSGAEPAVTESDATLCTKDIYNLAPSDPAYNADCRQFYNREGGISYHLYNRTISCSDDCHPYRKTMAADDTASACMGGGAFDASSGTCLYMAIPGQGVTCTVAQNGCREYTGNTGNDIRNIFIDDFSDGTTGGWVGVNGATALPSSEALTLDADNKGNSLSVSGATFSAKRTVGSAVTQDKSYVLSFVAKASAPSDLNLSLVNASGAKASFAKVSLSANWQIFQTNLANLNHAVSGDEIILLEGGQNFYIDSITLTEITDRYYLIKNSWQTPASCDEEAPGVPHELYMLGCGQYKNRANKIYYLKSFSELCSESAVGCELMIDTHNSTATTSETFTNNGTAKIVPADSFTYAVYDQAKQCGAEAKGCAILGKPYTYENSVTYGDVYLKNNPDKYNTILCGADAVGCQAFAYDKGEKYFKDPGDMVCEWRRAAGQGESQGWFKKKVKRCGSDTGAVCLTDADCSAGVKCQLETTDKPCPTDESKTLGIGGVGGRVSQPSSWAGVCAAADSGCGEYIDPVSKFNNNLIFNGNFQILATNKTDGWDNLTQSVTLEPNTVYRLGRAADAGSLNLSCPALAALYEINKDNNLAGPATSIAVNAAGYANSKIFYYKGGTTASCTITAGSSAGTVELKPAVINYQLAQNLDSTGCNGVVDFDKGCVLFNQRIQDGANLKALNYDANITNFSAPAVDADKNSNTILKVTPDRTCDKWLACRSYIKDDKGNNVCYDVGLCDAVDENGNCSSFLTSPKVNQVADVLGADKISNLSGYAKVGISGGSIISDYYPFGAMSQIGDVANLANGGFEYYGSNGYPVGWIWSGQEAAKKSWDANIFSVIDNPISAQAEGIGNAPEGRAFLKLGSSYDATSEEIDVMPKTDYIITAYVNTKNLKSGVATIDIDGTTSSKKKIEQNIGNDWQLEVGSFTTGEGVFRIKIKLAAPGASGTAGSEGNFYFDDIKIRPALNSKDNWNTTQSCRLYSKTDSLSCDYYEDSGNRQKGWYGYCLEYDRAPGNPNACILWYPVDKVKGDGIEEGAGYQGKAPVFYCTEAKNLIPVEYRKSFYYGRGTWDGCGPAEGGRPMPPANYSCADFSVDEKSGWDDVSFSYYPDGVGIILSDGNSNNTAQASNPTSANDGWYQYNGFLNFVVQDGSYYNEAAKGIKFYDPTTKQFFDDVSAYCTKVVQTVSSVGDNKYWASRVYAGTDWRVWFNNPDPTKTYGYYQYSTDGAPFGSVMAPSSNPYDWDGSTADGIQPLQVISPSSGGARASNPYMIKDLIPAIPGSFYGVCANSNNLCLHVGGIIATASSSVYELNKADCPPGAGVCQPVDFSGNPVDKLKLLFAKSYGSWEWNVSSSRYIADNSAGVNWNLPTAKCAGNTRTNPTDYCAVTPNISNVKINNSGSNVNLTKNGFVNLTFNTKVDSNQLPLVMYGVNWGDGESTTVTGVEMRDRPEASGNPHSLYHLYSYWDLKAKANSGIIPVGSCITVGGIGQCSITPKVQIKDNWGWCNGGSAMNDCIQWQSFPAEVVVKEK